MKVLFLDIDGVLNLWPKPQRTGIFDKTACINLEFLLNKVPDLNIVISSSWRYKGLDKMQEILQSNGIDPRRVTDVTGNEQSKDHKDHRGYQIELWLERHPDVKNFAIVDDNTDFVPLMHKLVKTNKYGGLTQSKVEKLIELLNE